MIQCPNCAKDIADDSAHCGFCGAKIQEEAGKKTMMGFAALTGDALKEAAAEAKEARQAAERARAERSPSGLPSRPTKDEPTDSRPKLPKLPQPTPAAGSTPAPGKLHLTGSAEEPTDSDAKTAVMGAVVPATIEEGAVGDTDPMPAADIPHDASTIPVQATSEETEPELIAPQVGGSSGPTELGGGGLGVDGPSEFGSGKIEIPQNTLPAKKKTNPALLIAGAVAFLLLACCVLSIAYNIILPIIMAL